MTATRTRCWRSWSPADRPALRASARASTTATSPPWRRTRCSRGSSGRSPLAPPGGRAAPTPPSCSPTRVGWGRRCRRRPRRSPARHARSPTSGSPRRPRTCSTTWPSCCARADWAWPTPSGCSMAVAADSLVVTPTADEAATLAGEHNLIPVRHTFIEDCETPVSAFLKLRGAGPAFLLESAEQGQRVGRWSFIGYKPRRVVRWSLGDGGDPYALAEAEVSRHRQAPLADLPPFAGGAVGYFGYDCVRAVERLPEPNPDVLGLPDMALMLSDVLVAFDHLRHTVTILANAYVDEDGGVEAAHARAVGSVREVRERLAGPLPPPGTAMGTPPTPPGPQVEPDMPRQAIAAV